LGSDSLDFFILEGLAEPQSCVPYDHIGIGEIYYLVVCVWKLGGTTAGGIGC